MPGTLLWLSGQPLPMPVALTNSPRADTVYVDEVSLQTFFFPHNTWAPSRSQDVAPLASPEYLQML